MGFTTRMIHKRGMTEDLLSARYERVAGTGTLVSPATVAGIPAVSAAIEFAAEAVAQLTPTVRQDDKPSKGRWQSRLFSESPNPLQDEFLFWHTISASVDHRSNAYIWKTKSGDRVISRTALHPDQVKAVALDKATGRKLFGVEFAQGWPLPPDVTGYGSLVATSAEVMHITGRGSLGLLMAPSPVERFKRSLGIASARHEYEESLLSNYAGYGLMISFPAGTTRAEAEEWRDAFDGRHAGPGAGGRTKIIGGGAEVTPVTMSPQDAQFIEGANLSIRDISHIYHAPTWLLAQDGSAKVLSSPEHEMQRWLYYYLGPRVARIESAINADPDFLFGNGLKFRFDIAGVVRGDLSVQDAIDHQQIQDGRLMVDEWREKHGKPPLPGGVGMIPQIVPVGGAPNPVTVVPQSPSDDEE